MRLPVNRIAPLAALILLAACGGGNDSAARGLPPEPANGPASDYPMVIGAPFTLDGVTYTPVDVMNYDAVGYAALGGEGGAGITGAHRTLPLPSYVEVTSLDSGKTILVRLERRGPMTNARLIDLSAGAAAQLGIAGQERAAVRVRRVNPPEAERALLRSGQSAPARMDTPKSLLDVLVRKLDKQSGGISPAPVAEPGKGPGAAPVATQPLAVPHKPAPRSTPATKPAPAPTRAAVPPAPKSAVHAAGLVVQVGAFSSRERAASVAAKVGAQLVQGDRLWRVRMGPYGTQAEANAALAKARSAGYSDARIQRAD